MPERDSQDSREHHQPEAAEDAGPETGGLRPDNRRGVVGEELVSKLGDPSIAVSMIAPRSTRTPKNRENHRATGR